MADNWLYEPAWPDPSSREHLTDEDVYHLMDKDRVLVEGGSGKSKEDSVVLCNVPSVRAGKEIALTWSQRVVENSVSDWYEKQEFAYVSRTDPYRFGYRIVVTLADGYEKEAWFDIRLRPGTRLRGLSEGEQVDPGLFLIKKVLGKGILRDVAVGTAIIVIVLGFLGKQVIERLSTNLTHVELGTGIVGFIFFYVTLMYLVKRYDKPSRSKKSDV